MRKNTQIALALISILSLPLLGIMPIALAAPRIALVIGNGNYADKPLSHPKRDAADVAALLRGLGFEVTEVTDLNLEQIEQRVRDFIDAGRTSSVRLFYYSGHGANHQNDSYLLPVGHGIQRAYEIKRRAYPVETLLEGLRAEASDGVNVILLTPAGTPRSARANPSAPSTRGWGGWWPAPARWWPTRPRRGRRRKGATPTATRCSPSTC